MRNLLIAVILMIGGAGSSAPLYNSIPVDRISGEPSPTGIPVNKMNSMMDRDPLPLPAKVCEFIAWEMKKKSLRDKYQLGALDTDLFYANFSKLGPDRKSLSFKASYRRMLDQFKLGAANLNDILKIAGSTRSVVEDLVKRDAVNIKNYHNFLKLMKLADYPKAGHPALVKYWRQYLETANNQRRKIEVIEAAAYVPALAREVVPVLNSFTAGDTGRYVAFWSKAAGIDDLNYFKAKLRDYQMIQFIPEYARISKKGNKAFDFAIANIKDFHLYNLLPLLATDCELSDDRVEKILNDYLSSKSFRIPYILGMQRPAISPQFYPVIDKMITESFSGNNAGICDLAVYPRFSLSQTSGIRRTPYPNRRFPPQLRPRQVNASQDTYRWMELAKMFDFRGFLYGRHPKELFDLLWTPKRNMKNHDLLMAGGPVIIPFLLEKISDEKPHSSIMACQYISSMGIYATKVASGPLMSKLQKSQSYFVQWAIIRTLGEIKAEAAVPLIKQYTDNQSVHKVVRLNAQQVLMLLTKK